MTVTKILGEQSGLQYQGVTDKSEADPRDNLINVLFTGEFKNGPYNKPFKVTQANMRAKLGFDPDSLQYQAIQDALNTGVPFVWVMRVSGKKMGCQPGTITIDPSKFNWNGNNLVLYAKITVDGETRTDRITMSSGEVSNYSNPAQGFTVSQAILNAMFFYSGIDLYRQSFLQVRDYFTGKSGINRYTGEDEIHLSMGNSVPLPGGFFYLQGWSTDRLSEFSENGHWIKSDVLLELLPAPNLQSNEQDIVMALWGAQGVSAHSCVEWISTAS